MGTTKTTLEQQIGTKVNQTEFNEFKAKGITFIGDTKSNSKESSKTIAITLGSDLTIKDENGNIKVNAEDKKINVSLN